MKRRTKVFKSYLMQLGKRGVKFHNAFDNFFSVWLTRRYSDAELEAMDKVNTKFDDIKEEGMIEISKLYHCKFKTVDQDTKLSSNVTYEKLKNIPASAYLFSVHDCPGAAYIQDDWNYVAYDYKVDELNYYNFGAQEENFSGDDPVDDDIETETQKLLGTYVESEEDKPDTDENFILNFVPSAAGYEEIKRAQGIIGTTETGEWIDDDTASLNVLLNKLTDQTPYLLAENYEAGAYYQSPNSPRVVPVFDHNFHASYWEENYGFNYTYNNDEYFMYSIPQTYLDESEVQATFDDISAAKVEGGPAAFGAVMVVYNNKYPVSYSQLPFDIKAKTCKVNIEWSTNGVIKAV